MGPHVEILLVEEHLPHELVAALGQLQAITTFRPIGESGYNTPTPDARIVVVPENAESGGGDVRKALEQPDNDSLPTLVLMANAAAGDATRDDWPGCATAVAGIAVDELVDRIKKLCASPVTSTPPRLQSPADHEDWFREQLRLAGQLQRDLLPELDDETFGRFSIRTLYRPVGPVSGDSFDVVRFPDGQIGLGVFDASGHGPAAAMLSMYVKRAVRELTSGRSAVAPEPDAVLRSLNEELLAADLTDCSFLAATFVVLDPATGQARWSHGGGPYPVLLRAGQPAELLEAEGGLIGAVPWQRFDNALFTLAPGDTLLLHTDGLEPLLSYEGGRNVTPRWCDTDWFRSLRANRVRGHLEAIDARLNYTPPDAWPADDVTVVAIECRPAP